jgi:hypothetical protein
MDDELTAEQQAEIDAALEKLTAQIREHTEAIRHQLALWKAQAAADEVRLLEAMWRL